MRFAEDEQDEYEGIEGDCLIRKAQHKKVVIPLPSDPIIIFPTYGLKRIRICKSWTAPQFDVSLQFLFKVLNSL